VQIDRDLCLGILLWHRAVQQLEAPILELSLLIQSSKDFAKSQKLSKVGWQSKTAKSNGDFLPLTSMADCLPLPLPLPTTADSPSLHRHRPTTTAEPDLKSTDRRAGRNSNDQLEPPPSESIAASECAREDYAHDGRNQRRRPKRSTRRVRDSTQREQRKTTEEMRMTTRLER
jgi:hypothetical protein